MDEVIFFITQSVCTHFLPTMAVQLPVTLRLAPVNASQGEAGLMLAARGGPIANPKES